MVHDIIKSEVVAGEMDLVAVQGAAGALDLPLTAAPVNGVDVSNWLGDKYFNPGDNILLANIWCQVPFGFAQGSGQHVLNLEWKDAANVSYSIPELGVGIAGEGGIVIPGINCAIPLPKDGLYIRVPTTGNNKKRLTIFQSTLRLSMVAIPGVLVGATVAPIYHFQVVHTQQMIP